MSTYVYVDGEADAFRGGAHGAGRKPVQRRTVDYTATTVRHIEVRGDLARDPTTTRASSIPNASSVRRPAGSRPSRARQPRRRAEISAPRARGLGRDDRAFHARSPARLTTRPRVTPSMQIPRAKTQSRVYQKHPFDNETLQATSGAMLDFMPPSAYPHLPATSFATKFVHVSTNKIRTGVNQVLFMPDGRRLLTCSMNGEFTMWNGMSFNFETILQAQRDPNRDVFAQRKLAHQRGRRGNDQVLATQLEQLEVHRERARRTRPRNRVCAERLEVLLVLGRHHGEGVRLRARRANLHAVRARRGREVRRLAPALGAPGVGRQGQPGKTVGRQKRERRRVDTRAQEPSRRAFLERQRELARHGVPRPAAQGV